MNMVNAFCKIPVPTPGFKGLTTKNQNLCAIKTINGALAEKHCSFSQKISVCKKDITNLRIRYFTRILKTRFVQIRKPILTKLPCQPL